MKVVIFIEGEKSSGGAEKIGFTTARLMAQAGHEVHIVTSAKQVTEDVNGATFHCLNLPFVWDSFFSRSKVEMIKSLTHDKERYDLVSRVLKNLISKDAVIHFHGYHNHFSFASVEAALDTKCPVFVTAHDYAYSCPISTFFDYPAGTICRRKPLSLDCFKARCVTLDSNRYKALRFFQLLGARLKNHPQRLAGVFAVSTFELEKLSPFLPAKTRLSVLPNPVPIEKPSAVNPRDRRGYLWVGRITQEKNLEVALKATAAKGVPLTVVGEGPEREKLQNTYPNATFLGWKSDQEVLEQYKSHKALLLTSAWYETASLVTLEAYAFGMPVIVPNENAARSWIPELSDQLCFDPGSPESLASRIELIENDEKLSEFSQTAYNTYWENPYTEERYSEALLSHYQTALAS